MRRRWNGEKMQRKCKVEPRKMQGTEDAVKRKCNEERCNEEKVQGRKDTWKIRYNEKRLQ